MLLPVPKLNAEDAGLVGNELLEHRLDVPERDELNFPDDDRSYRYDENDFEVSNDDMNYSGSANTIRKIRHTPTGVDFYKNNADDAVKYLIRFYGFGANIRGIHICTELMDGPLSILMEDIYTRNENFPPKLLQYIAVVLVKALDYLKSKLNIIHRDIKPDNILYKLKVPGCIKLTDFGISRPEKETAYSTMRATVSYVPPERVKNPGRKFGVESDIWGIGMVLLELLCNKYPLLDDNEDHIEIDEIQMKISELNNGLTVPERLELQDDCREFISTCLKPYLTRPKEYSELLKMNYIEEFDEAIFELADNM